MSADLEDDSDRFEYETRGSQMVDISQVYNTGWLKAEHLRGRDATVTIEEVTVQEFQDKNTGKTKNQLVLKFVGKDLRLGLNVTNARRIADNLGVTDGAGWIGKSITIFPTETEMGGEMKPCIRVRSIIKQKQSENPMNDEVPF